MAELTQDTHSIAAFLALKSHWESIPATNESYGCHKHDRPHKPASHFIQLLAMSVGKGGNMPLNLGPRGVIVPAPNATDFKTQALGEFALGTGEHVITIRPARITGANLMRLRRLELAVIP